MKALLTDSPLSLVAGLFFVVGLFVGNALFRWIIRLTPEVELRRGETSGENAAAMTSGWCRLPLFGPLLAKGGCRYRGVRWAGWGTVVELGTAGLFAAFVVAQVGSASQSMPEVQPGDFWRYGRIVYHLVLIALLIAATGTDFRDYVIPDRIVITGVLFAVVSAAVSGEMQLVPLWVDEPQDVAAGEKLQLLQWLGDRPHWRGLIWSLTGLAAGVGLTWIVRITSSLILGQEALGFGDVTLMGMIGSFLGWQPVLIVFLLAPFCGLLVALLVRMAAGRIYVPYGPFLSLAALVVLFAWRWIWGLEWDTGLREPLSLRWLFSDTVALGMIGGIAFGGLILVLTLLRIYRSVPGKRPSETSSERPEE